MKLTETNKEQNRAFHELPEGKKLDFLLNAYTEITAKNDAHKGGFALADIDLARLDKGTTRDERFVERDKLNANESKINFVMTRLNMIGDPQHEEKIKELALLRFEYMFMAAHDELTQDPGLVAEFLKRRGKAQLIRPVLMKMGERAIEYDHLAKRIINNSVFQEYVGAESAHYRFRARLHTLLDDEDFSKEQAAAKLMEEGFDLIGHDFNRWYKTDGNYELRSGEKKYKSSPKEKKWLADFVAQRLGHGLLEEKVNSGEDNEPIVPEDDEPSSTYECSLDELVLMNENIELVAREKADDPEFFWVKELSALTRDYNKIALDSSNLIHAKMWDYLWGGRFHELALQLKGANPSGRTRNGLSYNKWAMTHPEHSRSISPVLAQDSYAMILASDILVGNLDDARADFNEPALQRYKNPEKIKAAINLAWEMMHHPGESDDEEEYEPPHAFLFQVAKEFPEFLKETPRAAPYQKLLNVTTGTTLSADEEKILASVRSFEDIEKIYTRLGRAEQIKPRFGEIFDEVFEGATEYCGLFSDLSGIIHTIQDPLFQKYVDAPALSERFDRAIQKTLHLKSKYDPKRDQNGTKKMIAAMYGNPLLRQYVEKNVNLGELVNGMIDDVIGKRRDSFIHEPLSLRGQGELGMGLRDPFEAYSIADAFRFAVDSDKMSDLVACVIGLVADEKIDSIIQQEKAFMHERAQTENASWDSDIFSADSTKREYGKVDFISRVYEREKPRGGVDKQKVQTALTNVLFRANYAMPRRFYPHIDTMLQILDSPIAEVLPTEGLGHDAIKEYKILHRYLRSEHATE